MFFISLFRYRARDSQHIPRKGGGLVISNHQSFLDPLLVAFPLRRPVSNIARDSLFTVPVLRWILRSTYVFPISRSVASATSIRNAVSRMEHGFLVGIFPEGTRSADGQMLPFKPGFISLLRRSRQPIYPVGIAGADKAMPRGAIFPRFRLIRVVYGVPILPEEYEPYLENEHKNQLVQLVFERVQQCQLAAEAWRSGQPEFPTTSDDLTEL
jgi:1-acyl-sn-glycerol-3-phosphate acyltransferase